MPLYELRLSEEVDQYGINERYRWCMENITIGTWFYDYDTFTFINKVDALTFKMMFGYAHQIEDDDDMDRKEQYSEHCR